MNLKHHYHQIKRCLFGRPLLVSQAAHAQNQCQFEKVAKVTEIEETPLESDNARRVKETTKHYIKAAKIGMVIIQLILGMLFVSNTIYALDPPKIVNTGIDDAGLFYVTVVGTPGCNVQLLRAQDGIQDFVPAGPGVAVGNNPIILKDITYNTVRFPRAMYKVAQHTGAAAAWVYTPLPPVPVTPAFAGLMESQIKRGRLTSSTLAYKSGKLAAPALSASSGITSFGIMQANDLNMSFSGPLLPATADFSFTMHVALDNPSWNNGVLFSQYSAGTLGRIWIELKPLTTQRKILRLRIGHATGSYDFDAELGVQDYRNYTAPMCVQILRRGSEFSFAIDGQVVASRNLPGVELAQVPALLGKSHSSHTGKTFTRAYYIDWLLTSSITPAQLRNIALAFRAEAPYPVRTGLTPKSKVTEIDAFAAYLDNAWIVTCPNGDLLAASQRGGDVPFNTTKLHRSTDNGITWNYESTIQNLWAAKPFTIGNTLYAMGCAAQYNNLVIARSTDNGHTWTTATLRTGLYLSGGSTPVVVDTVNGRVIACFNRGTVGSHPARYSLAIQANTSADLLNPTSWTVSNEIDNFAIYSNMGALEGNVVVTGPITAPKIQMIWRTNNTPEDHALVADYSPETKTLSSPRLRILPGATRSKFWIDRVPGSGRLWMLHNDSKRQVRTRFIASYSDDHGLTWKEYRVISEIADFGPVPNWAGFQYATPIISGNTLKFVLRTSFRNGGDFHDAGQVEYFEVDNFFSGMPAAGQ